MKQLIERAQRVAEERAAERRARIAEAVRDAGVTATISGDAIMISGSALEQRLVDDADLRLAIGGAL